MRAERPVLTAPARGCVILLSLLLGAALTLRVYAYARPTDPHGASALEMTDPPIDLGAGILLPRALAGRYTVPVSSCPAPALVTFVWAGPYGSDPGLADARQPDDRVFYVYRGWNLGHRFATVGLNAIYFTRMAYARLSTGRNPAADAVAAKITVPAGCDASPDDVLAVLRRHVEPAN